MPGLKGPSEALKKVAKNERHGLPAAVRGFRRSTCCGGPRNEVRVSGGDDKAHEIVEHERARLFVIYDLVQRRRSALHDDALDERCAQFRAFTHVIFVVLAQMGPERFEDLVRDEPNLRDRRTHVEVAVVPATLAASDAMFPVLQVDEQDPVVSDHDGIDLAVLSRSDGDLEIRVGVPLPRQMPKLA